MNSSDSAEEIVKLSLDGMEFALKIAGQGAMNIAVLLYNIAKDKQQTKGKIRLSNMLRNGKALKIFTLKAEDLKKFSQEAKKYGVLYCVLADKKNEKLDGMVDILVREEDAAKINRIVERFDFARVDTATIKKEIELEKDKIEQKDQEELMIEELLGSSIKHEEQEIKDFPSNNTKKTVEESQLENSLDTKQNYKMITEKNNKKSVKEELKEIEQELQENNKQEKQVEPQVNIQKKKQAKRYKDKKEQQPKHLRQPKHMQIEKKKNKKSKKKERQNR